MIFTISALSNDPKVKENSNSLLQTLNNEQIKSSHLASFIDELKADCQSWNDNSFEPVIFSKLLKDWGKKI